MPLAGYLQVSEAVERIGLSRRSISRRCKAGQVPGAVQDAGGSWHIPEAAVESIARQRRPKTAKSLLG